MSKKKNKERTKWVSKRSITLLCTVIALAVCIGGIGLFVGMDGYSLFSHEVTIDVIEERSLEAINKCDYALLSLSVQETVVGEGVFTQQYILSSSKNSSEHSYLYIDTDGTELYQYWFTEEGKDECTIYIYDEVTKAWVKTSYPYEPISSDTWNMLTDLSRYEILPGTYKWVNSDDDCYVLEMLGANDEFAQIYEQIYIRKSDFMPMGILSYAISDVSYDRLQSNELAQDLNGDGVMESATVESPTYNELVQIYEIKFSESDLKPFGIPEDYITEEEYMDRMRELEEVNNEE